MEEVGQREFEEVRIKKRKNLEREKEVRGRKLREGFERRRSCIVT